MERSWLKAALMGGCLIWASLTQAEVKIGYVDAEQVLEKAPQVEAARKRLEKEFKPRDRELVAMQKEIKRLEEQLARDKDVMSESQRAKLERKILTKKRELKRAQAEFREDFNIRRNEEFDKLQRQIHQAIIQLAKDEKFDLILGDGVIYASKRVNITDKVLKRLKSLR
ncbi:MAG: OmpH family outer membrane protein [Gammaproteobacteria bacterium]|nr:MAG: OmpH family outer membrane protein [Gammaproteobacteria bacterium]